MPRLGNPNHFSKDITLKKEIKSGSLLVSVEEVGDILNRQTSETRKTTSDLNQHPDIKVRFSTK